MIQVSSAAGAAIESTSRQWRARVLYDGSAVACTIKTIKVTGGSNANNSFSVGAVLSPTLEMVVDNTSSFLWQDREVQPQVGVVLPNNSVEWVSLGYFTITRVEKAITAHNQSGTSYQTTLTGNGRIASKLSTAYTKGTSAVWAVSDQINRINNLTGLTVTLDFDISSITPWCPEVSTPRGATCRDVLQIIAMTFGGFAYEKVDGSIHIGKYSGTPTYTLPANRMTSPPKFADYDYTITGVAITVRDAYTSVVDGQEEPADIFQRGVAPYLAWRNVYNGNFQPAKCSFAANNLIGQSWRSGIVDLALGDPRVEASDVLEVTDINGAVHSLPCHNIQHSFDGGFKTTITAYVESTSSAEIVNGLTGTSITSKVDQLDAALLNVGEAVAERVTTTYLTTHYLTANEIAADYVQTDNLAAEVADLGYVTADEIDAEIATLGYLKTADLDAENARLGYVTATEVAADYVATNDLAAEVATLGYATVNELHSDYLNATQLSSTYATISDLTADYLTANQIQSTYLQTANLDAAVANVGYLKTANLDAAVANVGYLKTADLDAENASLGYVTAGTVAANYVKTDATNIGTAVVQKILGDSGLISNITIGTGTVTGNLQGVVISGDLIEANTLKANRLVILGTDGLYYQLNANGETSEAAQNEYNSLDGSHIQAQSITANKIAVTDLEAFGATIGMFEINADYDQTQSVTQGSINSAGKTAADDNVEGVFIGIDGTGTDTVATFGIGSASGEHIYYDGEHIDIQSNSLNATLEQMTLNFNQYADNAADSVRQYAQENDAELKSYIRFSNNGITLGKADSPVQLVITPTDISFHNATTDVDMSQWANTTFQAVDGDFDSSLKIGKFAFIPRTNGNLSFKKVED